MKNKKLRTRQVRTMEMLAKDYTYADIIGETGITRKAVDGRIARLKKTFEVKTTWGLMAEVTRCGLIDLHGLQKIKRRH